MYNQLMNKNIYENHYKIRYSEMDCNLLLKPSALLHLLQDTASNNAEQLGFGYSFLADKNLAWFLLKYHMEFTDFPKEVYNLNIETEPRGWSKLFAYRDFIVCNNDKILGKVASTWALIDLNTKRMANIGEILSSNPHFNEFIRREDDLKYNKITPLQNIDNEKTFETRFDDLDVNQHVNNANYPIWAFETLDYEFRRTKKLKTLDIVFKKEVKYGASIISEVQISENTTNHILKEATTNEDLCLIQAEWE